MYINTLNKLFYSKNNDHITLHKGFINVKTVSSSEQFKKYYMVLKKINKDNKYYLECYKDEMSKKLVFLIDMNRVDEIDFIEATNSIRLRGKDQICLLNSTSKIIISTWLNVLCKTLGFTEQPSSSTTSSLVETNSYKNIFRSKQELNDFNEKENLVKNTSKIRSKLEKSVSSNIESNRMKNSVFSPPPFKKSQSDLERKSIAGKAALSIGSIDLISSSKLDILFRDNNQNHYEIFSSICKLKPDEVDSFPLNGHYLTLDECVSGQDDLPNVRSVIKIQPPKSFSPLNDLSNITSPTSSTTSSNKSSIFDLNNKISYVQLIVDDELQNTNIKIDNNSFSKENDDVNSYIENFKTIPLKDNNKRSSNANESLFNSSIKTDFSDPTVDYTNVDSVRTIALKNAIVKKKLDAESNN